jgi:sigma-B regulation protein RsbU (phosphoserine phosphatase)
MRITPRLDENGSVAYLIHHTIRLDQPQEQAKTVAADLQGIDRSPRDAIALYRKHIERSIEIDGFRVLKDLRPLEEVGGDFLWHHRYTNGTTDLVHGDAMGHGQAAALYAARIVLVLNAVCDSQVSPAGVIAEANEKLAVSAAEDEVNFATGLLLRFHPGSEQLTVCAFAHNGVLFSRTGIVPIQTGPPIGLTVSTDPWPETTLNLAEHGRRFLLFSDGITEQFDEHGDFFGVERLLEIFRRTENRPLEQLLGEIHDALESFRGAAIIKDDRTLLAIEYEGTVEIVTG